MRVHRNFAYGQLTVTAEAADVTMTSSQFAALPVISGSDLMPITLDPDGTYGTPEIVWITGHTAGSSDVTVARAQELADGGSTARRHIASTVWRQAATAADLAGPTLELGYAESSTSFVTSAVTGDDIPGLSVTVACDGSPIWIDLELPQVSNDTAGQAFAVNVLEDATTLRVMVGEKSTAANDPHPFVRSVRRVPAAGNHTYKAQLYRTFGGSGAISSTHGATNPGFIAVRRA